MKSVEAVPRSAADSAPPGDAGTAPAERPPRRRFSLPGLPLLARELTEQAARRRTYVLRVIYACLLFGLFLLAYAATGGLGRATAITALGTGRLLFDTVVGLQFLGIYLFMPALVCATITHEKERSTLELLLLTRLGAGTIVLEKLLSRIVPMLTLLLLSLPLLGLAYMLGGVQATDLPLAAWVGGLTILQTGSLALLCSAWFRSTFVSFIAVYLTLILTFVLFMSAVTGQPVTTSWPWMVMFLPVVYEELRAADIFIVFAASLPMLVSSAVSLIIAAACLRRRAALPGGNLLLKLFHRLDRVIKTLNDRFCRGRMIFDGFNELPDTAPVAWRETQKTALGAPRFLVRVLLALEVPVAAYCVLALPTALAVHALPSSATGRWDPLDVALVGVWTIAVLLVAVKGASLVSAERSRQTLDVLLTTPLAGRELLLQKFQGLRRLIWVMRVPLLTILFCDLYVFLGIYRQTAGAILQVIMLVCDLPMIAWMSCWIGLRSRSQAQAILITLGVLCAWCVAASQLNDWLFTPAPLSEGPPYLLALSPAKILTTYSPGVDQTVVMGCGCSIGLWALFRWRCLSTVNQRLGRTNETEPAPDDEPSPLAAQAQ